MLTLPSVTFANTISQKMWLHPGSFTTTPNSSPSMEQYFNWLCWRPTTITQQGRQNGNGWPVKQICLLRNFESFLHCYGHGSTLYWSYFQVVWHAHYHCNWLGSWHQMSRNVLYVYLHISMSTRTDTTYPYIDTKH